MKAIVVKKKEALVMSRLLISSASKWEPIVGYSRAVRVDNLVFVAGTTAANADGTVVGDNDGYLQTREILRRIGQALEQAGASLEDVAQTRMFVSDISRWEDIGRAHGEVFADIRPVATMVEVKQLIDARLLVEIEAVAVISKAEKE
jgi:enamine deaminase RidA (YjgF/YER057c/UK114 family)